MKMKTVPAFTTALEVVKAGTRADSKLANAPKKANPQSPVHHIQEW